MDGIGVFAESSCFNRAVALELRMAGTPASAAGSAGTSVDDAVSLLYELYPQGTTSTFSTVGEMQRMLLAAGEGTRGVVLGTRVGAEGHAFNAAVSNGRVIFLDAARQGRATVGNAGYAEFRVFFTQIGGGW